MKNKIFFLASLASIFLILLFSNISYSQDQLIFWNKLEHEVDGYIPSEIGPDAFYDNLEGELSFESFKFGNGVRAPYTGADAYHCKVAIDITELNLTTEKGTFEFWWKAAYNDNKPNQWRSWLSTADVVTHPPDPPQSAGTGYLDFSNDRFVGGRHTYRFSIGSYPCSTENVLHGGSGELPSQWNEGDEMHLAIIYDRNGIPDTGGKTIIIFRDGVEMCSTTDNNWVIVPIKCVWLMAWAGTSFGGDTRLLGYPGAGGVMDNFKIYNYAKTDFSDRFIENPVLTVNSHTPTQNELNVPTNSNITVEFSANIDETTLDDDVTFNVDGSISGEHQGDFSGGGTNTITFNPVEDFVPGEVVTVTLTTGIQSTVGANLEKSYSWQFTVESQSSCAIFSKQQVISTSAIGALYVCTADIDGDSDLDVISSCNSGKIAWYENGNSWNETPISTDALAAFCVHAADIDGDGDMDVLSTSETNEEIAWYENGNSWNKTVISDSAFNGPRTVYAADMDGDGDLDVLSSYRDGYKIVWYENGNSWYENTISTTANYSFSVYPADMDGDGDLDVLSHGNHEHNIVWYENGNLWQKNIITTDTWGSCHVYAADMDGDGDLDALSASYLDNKIAWFENGNSWNKTVISANADAAYCVYAADMDGDGDLDVLSASGGDDKIAWYENGNVWNETVISNDADNAGCVYAADMDGDGDLDVLSSSDDDNKIAWYVNCTDFGDLPASYNLTTNSDDGARHNVSDLYLGTSIDGETDGQESDDAGRTASDGDDGNDQNDENGVVINSNWHEGINGGSIEVTVTGGPGFLSGWIDWEHNADLIDAGEHILDMKPVTNGTQTIYFDVPAGVITPAFSFQDRFARFRLIADNETPLTLTGLFNNGEVEDHYLRFYFTADFPEIDIQRPAGNSILDGSIDNVSTSDTGYVRLRYTVDNTAGAEQLDIIEVTATNLDNCSNFSVDTVLPLKIAAGSTDTLDISFDVDSSDVFGLDMVFSNNDQDEYLYNIEIDGSVIEAMAQFSIPDTTAYPSQMIKIPVSVSTDSSISVAQFVIDYDSTVIDFQSAEVGSGAAGFGIIQNSQLPFNPSTEGANANVLVQVSGAGTNYFTGENVEVVLLTFHIVGINGDSTILAFDTDVAHTFLSTLNLNEITDGEIHFHNGSIKIPDFVDLTGIVFYDNTIVNIPNADVVLNGETVTTTDQNGEYEILQINPGTYNLELIKTSDQQDAITGTDPLYILQALAFMHELTAEEMRAADVTGDGLITGSDAIAILRYLAFFTIGIGNSGHWEFLPEDTTINLINNQTIDFIAYLKGDANLSWGSSVTFVSNGIGGDSENCAIKIGGYEIVEGRKIKIPIYLEANAAEVNSILFSFKFDPQKLEHIKTIFNHYLDDFQIIENSQLSGQLHLAMVGLNGFSGESKILEILFERSKNMEDYVNFEISRAVVNDAKLQNLPTLVIDKINPTYIKSYHLYQNFPNPFNSETQIRYDIPDKVRCILKIYNLAGQEVTTLVDKIHEPGSYSLNWNGTDNKGKTVNSGIYVYELIAGQHTSSRKTLIIK